MTLQPTDTEIAFINAARRDDQPETARLQQLINNQQAATEQRLTTPTALLNAALWYAGTLGWAVFPLKPGQSRPATPHGFHDATTNLDQIRAWWTSNPHANIGLPTGHTFDVVDIDGPEGTWAVGPHIDSDAIVPFAVAKTPRGKHLYIPPTGQRNSTNAKDDVDFRGVGGYCVAPPSNRPDGTYRWIVAPKAGDQ